MSEFDWNLATVWETIAEEVPNAPAQVHGERAFSWADFDERSNGLAAALLDDRASRDDRVALYLRNSPEYMEVQHAAFKIGIPAVNTNYRYRDEELRYLFEDADVTSVVFHGSFTETMEGIRPRSPSLRRFIHVDDGTEPCPDWAVPYEQAAASAAGQVRSPWGRSGEDLFLLYTGGTTGMPKGVMWRVEDMLRQVNDVAEVSFDLGDAVASIRASLSRSRPVHVSCSPMMHGSGWFGAVIAMHQGGTVASLVQPSLDPAELLDLIDRLRVSSLTIAGEVFARRILAMLEQHPERWDSTSIRDVLTSGGMLSEASKRSLLEHWPQASILDGFSSSEGFGMGWSVATKEDIPPTGRFRPGRNLRVLDEEGRRRVRSRRQARPERQVAPRLLQGPGKDPAHLPDDRRRTIGGPRRPRHRARRRHHPVDGPGFPLHQLRRREDLHRRGRGGHPRSRGGQRRSGRWNPRPGVGSDRGRHHQP
ncbi:AMP-binding protein [Actinomadura napierensis]